MNDLTGKQAEITISISKVYRIASILLVPLLLLLAVPYILIWENNLTTYLDVILHRFHTDWSSLFLYLELLRKILLFSLLGIAGAIIHELLHAVVWLVYLHKGFRILKFGIMSPDMSPYVHCKEPLPVWVYRIGIVLPALVLGILPAVAGIVTGIGLLFLFGFFFTWTASGDLIVLWMIRHLNPQTMVKDHPVQVGCIIMEQ